MGSFLTNVQLKLSAAAVSEVRTALEAAAVKMGYARHDGPDGADRSIVVIAHPDGDWVGVYDEESEQQSGMHQALGEELSRALSTHAVSILVHDSDVLQMDLFQNGRRLDTFSNWPGYFEGLPQKASGSPSCWEALLPEGKTLADLKRLWSETSDACEALFAMAQLLEMEPALAQIGFNYLDDAEQDIRGPEVRLHFKNHRRPAHERRQTGQPRLVAGMPGQPDEATTKAIFAELGREVPVRVFGPREGQRSFELPVVIHNDGGESQGVHVLLMGPALDDGGLRVPKITVYSVKEGFAGEIEEVELKSGKRGLSAEIPDVPLHAGPLDSALVWDMTASLEKLAERNRHVLTVQLHCELDEVPETPVALVVAVAPLDDPQAGCAEKVLIGKTDVPRRYP